MRRQTSKTCTLTRWSFFHHNFQSTVCYTLTISSLLSFYSICYEETDLGDLETDMYEVWEWYIWVWEWNTYEEPDLGAFENDNTLLLQQFFDCPPLCPRQQLWKVSGLVHLLTQILKRQLLYTLYKGTSSTFWKDSGLVHLLYQDTVLRNFVFRKRGICACPQ